MCNYLENLILVRKQSIREMIKNIEINSEYEEGSYTFAIYGEYGSGKTYFLNAFQEILSNNNNCQVKEEFELQANFKLIKINAWEEDYLKDPILSIGLKIANEMKKEIKDDKEDEAKDNKEGKITDIYTKLTESLLLLNQNRLLLVKNLLLNAVKNNPYGNIIINAVEETLNDANKNINEYYLKYKDYLKNIKESLTEYIEKLKENQADKTKNTKLLILVDELDRCRPDYAIEFLEAINHIFSVKNLIFVFSIDKNALKSAMTTIYGANMDFDNYMKKFIHSDVSLNKLTDSDNEEIIEHYIKIYYKDKNEVDQYALKKNLTLILNHFELNPRNIEYMIRICKSLDKELSKNNEFIMPLIFTLSCIKSKYHDEYYELFNNKLDFDLDMFDIDLKTLCKIFDKIDCRFDFYIPYNNLVELNTLHEILFVSSIKINDYFFREPRYIDDKSKKIFDKNITELKKNLGKYIDENSKEISYKKFIKNEDGEINRVFLEVNKSKDKSLMRKIFEIMQ